MGYTTIMGERVKIPKSFKNVKAFIESRLTFESYFLTFAKGLAQEVADFCDEDNTPYDVLKKRGSKVITNCRQNINNWKKAKDDDAYYPRRKQAIEICFTLELNLLQAEEFLCKACNQDPLNVKSPEELIYYYCFKFDEPYSKALELKKKYTEKLTQCSYDGYESEGDDTVFIRGWIDNIEKDDNAFIDELAYYSVILTKESNTSKREFLEYLSLFREEVLIGDDDVKIDGIDELSHRRLMILTGLNRQEIQRIQKDESCPGRKFIVLIFTFQKLYAFENAKKLIHEEEDPKKCAKKLERFNSNKENRYNEFCFELNDILERCGMSPLYPRSRFDWVIMHSVYAEPEEEYSYDYLRELLKGVFS